MIAGICAMAALLSRRRCFNTSAPSMPGMSKSSRRSEGGSARSDLSASIPSGACVQAKPALVRMRERSLRLVASSSATRIRSPDFLAILFSLIRNAPALELYFFLSPTEDRGGGGRAPRPISRAWRLHLAIVSGPTLNYNGEAVVEIAYETFAL